MFFRILIVACFVLSTVQAQDIQYVFAENGLVMREQPNQGATKVGILDYGTPVEVIAYTDLSLDVKDNNTKVSGQWVKIKGPAAGEYFDEAYVFSGYLTEDKIERPLKIRTKAFTVLIDKLDRDAEAKTKKTDDDISALFTMEEGKSPENRYLKVKHHKDYRKIEVFQSYKNSIAVSTKDNTTKVVDFQHYISSWKPLKKLPYAGNIFKTMTLSEKDKNRFGTVDITKLKAYLETEENISFRVVPTEIELKVIITDINGDKVEKIINFELPLKA